MGPGWYRIVINNPHRVTGDVVARLVDERGVRVNQAAISQRSPRSAFFQRLVPGKYKIAIGDRAEWVVNLTVIAGR